jgi:hypothetical protein
MLNRKEEQPVPKFESRTPEGEDLEVLAAGVMWPPLTMSEWVNWSIDYNSSCLPKIEAGHNPHSLGECYKYHKSLQIAAQKYLKEKNYVTY